MKATKSQHKDMGWTYKTILASDLVEGWHWHGSCSGPHTEQHPESDPMVYMRTCRMRLDSAIHARQIPLYSSSHSLC